MTSLVDTNILQQILGGSSVKAASAISGQGKAPGGGLDFISLILNQLQENGQLKVGEGTSLQNAKDQLSAIISGLSKTVEGSTDKSAAPLLNALKALDVATSSTTQAKGQTSPSQGGLLNNPLLAQQLGLDSKTATNSDIVSAIQNTLAEAGIDININVTENGSIQIGEQGFTQEKFEARPAKDIPAHLNTLNSPQETAQNASSVSGDQNATHDTSPLNAQVDLAASPNAGQNTVADTGAEEAVFSGKNASLLEQMKAAQNETNKLLQDSGEQPVLQAQAALGQPAPGQKGQKSLQDTQMQQTMNKGSAPQSKGSLPASPQNTSSPNNGVQVATQTSASQNLTANTSPMAGGADSFSEFTMDDGTMNTFTSSSDGFDGDALNHFRQETLNSTGQKHATQQSFGTKYNAPQSQVVRATLVNMTRGSDNNINRLSMQLEPADLGRIDVELKMSKDGNLKAHIMTDKADTLNILQKDSSALQKALQEAGLDVGSDSFSFDLRDQNDGQLAQDKDSREMLFNVDGLADIESDMDGINDNYLAAGAYGQIYASAGGVNIFV